ncbi:hypothetical protein AHF37_06623 [Paragonimus kellicotti]|nr:hypothetical protein AHF37_06623 [Paragonimus kellicotti]
MLCLATIFHSLISSPAGPRMHTVTLRFMRPVDRARFTNCLKALYTDLKPWPFYGNVYSVNGQLSFIGEPDKLYDVFHITLSGVSRIVCTLSSTERPKTKSNKPFWLTGILAAPSKEDKVSDEKLCNQFANWLRQAAPQQERVRPLLRLSDLTSQDLEKIHTEIYHLHSLPPGWFYTGAYYVNMNGEKSFQHPNFDAFVKEYLEGENTKIAARNARITSHPIPDLFSDPS